MSIIKVMPLSKQNKAYYSQAKKSILNKKLTTYQDNTVWKTECI